MKALELIFTAVFVLAIGVAAGVAIGVSLDAPYGGAAPSTAYALPPVVGQ